MSEVAKKYILSIDEEAKEYFDKTLSLIKDKIKQEVLSAPLVSSYDTIRNIVDREMSEFIQTVISLIDYYTEGIYHSGKMVSRKKLKLGKQIPDVGKKYSFTNNDKLFMDSYKGSRLKQLNLDFEKAVVNYLLDKLSNVKTNGKWNLLNNDDYNPYSYSKQELSDKEMDMFVESVEDSFSDVFDQLMDAVAREIIQLFRRAQVEEYRNLGIDAVVFVVEDESLCCPACNTRAGKIVNLDNVVLDYGITGGSNHSFCKNTIDPVISYRNQITNLSIFSDVTTHVEQGTFNNYNSIFIDKEIAHRVNFKVASFEFENVPVEMEYRIIKLIKKLQIYANQFLSHTKFIFSDNITDIDVWFDSVKNHYLEKGKSDFEATNEAKIAQDKFFLKVASFDDSDVYYVSPASFDSQLIEDMLLRKIIKDKVEVTDWVKDRYDEKIKSKHIGAGIAVFQDPFVSYLAQDTVEDYLIESVVAYVNQPIKLKTTDISMFNYVKENIFNSIEFF